MYHKRKFLIFDSSELNKVDFSEVFESIDTVRQSIDKSKTLIKWDEITAAPLISEKLIPSFVENIISKQGPYSYEEILLILNSNDWKEEI